MKMFKILTLASLICTSAFANEFEAETKRQLEWGQASQETSPAPRLFTSVERDLSLQQYTDIENIEVLEVHPSVSSPNIFEILAELTIARSSAACDIYTGKTKTRDKNVFTYGIYFAKKPGCYGFALPEKTKVKTIFKLAPVDGLDPIVNFGSNESSFRYSVDSKDFIKVAK